MCLLFRKTLTASPLNAVWVLSGVLGFRGYAVRGSDKRLKTHPFCSRFHLAVSSGIQTISPSVVVVLDLLEDLSPGSLLRGRHFVAFGWQPNAKCSGSTCRYRNRIASE